MTTDTVKSERTVKDKKHKGIGRIWFDLVVFTYFGANSKLTDDTINFGSFSIDEKEIKNVSADAICDYILAHQDIFFDSDNYKEMKKETSYRAIKTSCITYKSVYFNNDEKKYSSSQLFVTNIRFFNV